MGRGNEADVSETKQEWTPDDEPTVVRIVAAVNALSGVRLASDAPGTVRALIVEARDA